MSKTTIDESSQDLTQILKRPARTHVVSELLDGLMDQFGGPNKFAAAFFQHYNASKNNPMTRARMLGDVMKLFVVQSNLMKAHATPIEGMTDAELVDTARVLFHVGDGREAQEGGADGDAPA